jgi:uncharacterized protein
MSEKITIDIGPMSAKAFAVKCGQRVKIIDTEGGQPGDFVAFKAEDFGEFFSQSRTRVENQRYKITTGHKLWTNVVPANIMFEVVADMAGNHDLLYTPCSRDVLVKRFGVSRDGCLENLARALSDFSISQVNIPDPLNLFFNVDAAPEGNIAIASHQSQAGDFIELGVRMNCIVAISACSVPHKNKTNSGFTVEISE